MKDFEQERKINYGGYGLFVDEEFGYAFFGENTQNFVVEKERQRNSAWFCKRSA